MIVLQNSGKEIFADFHNMRCDACNIDRDEICWRNLSEGEMKGREIYRIYTDDEMFSVYIEFFVIHISTITL